MLRRVAVLADHDPDAMGALLEDEALMAALRTALRTIEPNSEVGAVEAPSRAWGDWLDP